MAKSGFKTYTEEGILQLDSSIRNYSLIKKTTVSCTSAGNGFVGNFKIASISIESETDVIPVIKSTVKNQLMLIYSINKKAKNYNITIASNSRNPIEVYIFAMAPEIKAKYGLNLYDEDGVLTFSSATPYLNIAKIFNVDLLMGTKGYKADYNSDYYGIAHPPLAEIFSYTFPEDPQFWWVGSRSYSLNEDGFTIHEISPNFRIDVFTGVLINAQKTTGNHLLVNLENTKNIDFTY